MRRGYLQGSVKHPKIYIYSLEEFSDTPWKAPNRTGRGLLKIGYTENDVDLRIDGQLNPILKPKRTTYQLVDALPAIDKNGVVFMDKAVHRALTDAGIGQIRQEGSNKLTEFFECTEDEAIAAIRSVQQRVPLEQATTRSNYEMRAEQLAAVDHAENYFGGVEDRRPQLLWNAKMRFGKTFTAYQLAKRMGWTRILVLTFKPAVEPSWSEELSGHADFIGWRFHGRKKRNPPRYRRPFTVGVVRIFPRCFGYG